MSAFDSRTNLLADDDEGTLTPVRAARRGKVLVAAEALFAAQGFRGTKMGAIAEAAAISIFTVYGYFRDKDAVFAAVAERLAARLAATVRAELAAKQAIVFELVRWSAFPRKLFQARDMHVAHLFGAQDAELSTC